MNENSVNGEGAQDTALPPSGGAVGQEASGGASAADWRASLPGGWADRLKDVGSAEEAMEALERGLSYHPARSAEDIRLDLPESLKGQVDEGVQQHFRELCVQEGITPAQAQALLDWQLAANREMADRRMESGVRVLKSAWGSRFEENRGTALKAFSALDRRMGGELSGSFAGRSMANDPAFVRAFYEIGRMLSEDTLFAGAAPGTASVRESAEDTYNGMFGGK